jgi:hypothetical protein
METLLNAWADDVVRLEQRVDEQQAAIASLEQCLAERQALLATYRELTSILLTACHRLIAVVRRQKRALNTYTRTRETTYAQEIRAIDQSIVEHLG